MKEILLDTPELMGYNMGIKLDAPKEVYFMPRPAILKHPVRLHLTLEKETVEKLKKLAKERSESLTEIIRDLAASYAQGMAFKRAQRKVIDEIHAMRKASPKCHDRSEDIIRALRDA